MFVLAAAKTRWPRRFSVFSPISFVQLLLPAATPPPAMYPVLLPYESRDAMVRFIGPLPRW